MDKTFEFDPNKIERVSIEKIKPNTWNPKPENPPEMEKIKRSLEINGYAQPILVRKVEDGYEILDGQHRYLAAKELGYEELYIYNAGEVNDEEAKAMTIWMQTQVSFDDQLLAPLAMELKRLDMELPYSDKEMIKFENMLAFDMNTGETKEDETPEVDENEPPKSKLGEVYALGRHKLMCGDSTSAEDVQALRGEALVDLWLTDPPYNVAYEGKTSEHLTIVNDKQSDGDFRAFLNSAFATATSAMKPGAAFYIWHADSEGFNFRGACKDSGLTVRECLVWNKNSMVMGRQDYQWKHEPCLYGWKDGTHNWYSDRKQTTVIDLDRPTASKEHPTMKPVGLFSYLIQNSTKRDDLVLDTFGGSGTTLIACEQLGRRCLMMELDPKYCDVIRKRYWRFTHDGDETGWEEGTLMKEENETRE